jgi:uridine phosphorylase
MAYPNLKNKHAQEAMFSPQDFWDYLKKRRGVTKLKPPESVILCYQRSLMKYILDKHKTTRDNVYHSGMYLLEETGGKVAVMGGFGIGAPAAVTVFEELVALGVKKFISIGSAGTLQKDIRIGDLIVCERAIRDEGTSHHYLKPSKYAYASKELTIKIKKTLDSLKCKYTAGTSWTIDAPYRETLAEARQYQKEGVATVEMEASALFAVAQYRKVELGALFTISDSLADMQWKPKFHLKKTDKGLEIIYRVALTSLLT